MPVMKRRDFLKYNSLTIPSIASGIGVHTLSKSPFLQALYNEYVDTDKILVIINLSGGNDGLGTVIPLDIYGKLADARPEVIIDKNKLLKLEDDIAFHPSMTELRNLYTEGKMSIVQGVGYPNQDYSHFRSTDIWMTGSDADEIIYTGWLGRYLNLEYPNFPVDYPNDLMPDPLGIQVGYNLSVAFQGPASSMGMVVADPTWFYDLINDEIQPAPNTQAGKKLEYIRLITKQSQVYGEVITKAAAKVASQNSYPDTNLANQLKIVSRLIAGGLKTRLYMVSLDGFDTHDNQVITTDHSQGEHANLLTELSGAVAAFLKDLDSQGTADRVLTMTMSEFGRRIISNASNGTDHGASAPMMFFGNNIEPGIFGSNPNIPDNPTWEDNLPMQFDFRSIYHTVLQDWFCLSQTNLGAIFTQNFQTLPIVKNSPCISTATKEVNRKAGRSLIEVSPNPFTTYSKAEFVSDGEAIIVQLFNSSGQMIQTIAQGKFPEGKHSVTFETELLPAGNYFIRYQTQYFQQGKWLVKVR